MKQILLAIFAAAVAAYPLLAVPHGHEERAIVSFPSEATAVSPDGRFSVVSVDSNTFSDLGQDHILFLQDMQTQAKRKLLDYYRSVDVLWNPDSSSLAVTNYVGSNVADCLVFFIATDRKSVNVADKLRITDPQEVATLDKSSHIYWGAVRWTSSQSLLVKVWGHTDAQPVRGFEYFHTYQLTGRSR